MESDKKPLTTGEGSKDSKVNNEQVKEQQQQEDKVKLENNENDDELVEITKDMSSSLNSLIFPAAQQLNIAVNELSDSQRTLASKLDILHSGNYYKFDYLDLYKLLVYFLVICNIDNFFLVTLIKCFCLYYWKASFI